MFPQAGIVRWLPRVKVSRLAPLSATVSRSRAYRDLQFDIAGNRVGWRVAGSWRPYGIGHRRAPFVRARAAPESVLAMPVTWRCLP